MQLGERSDKIRRRSDAVRRKWSVMQLEVRSDAVKKRSDAVKRKKWCSKKKDVMEFEERNDV